MRRSLTYAYFGGAKGVNLSHVAFLAVWMMGESAVMGIEIGYDTDQLPTWSLGSCTPSEIQSQQHLLDHVSGDIRRLVFEIDGSNGEYITALYTSKMLVKMNGDTVFAFQVRL